MSAAASAAERALLRFVSKGMPYPEGRHSVSGAFLAGLVESVTSPSLELSGLDVAGPLDLSGVRPAARRLIFRDCRFDSGVLLAGFNIGHLEWSDCALVQLDLCDASIERLRIQSCRATSHVRAKRLLAGSIDIAGGHISGSLDLEGASIARSVRLAACRVGSGKQAINAPHSKIGRTFHFGTGVRAEGAVSLEAAEVDALLVEGAIDGSLDLGRSRIDRIILRGSLHGIRLHRAETGQIEIGEEAIVAGVIDARGWKVAGDFRSAGSHQPAAGPAIAWTAATFGGDVSFSGQMRCAGAALDVRRMNCGRLQLAFQAFAGGLSIRQSACSGLAMTGAYHCPDDMPLHLGLNCSGRTAIGSPKHPFALQGALSLIEHRCGELFIRSSHVTAPRQGPWRGIAIAGRHVEVAGAARIGHAPDGADGVVIVGATAFDQARFGDDLRFSGVLVDAPESDALDRDTAVAVSLRAVTVQGSLAFGESEAAILSGTVDLDRVNVAGDLRLGALQLHARSPSLLNLAGARVLGRLAITGLQLSGSWRIALDDAEIALLDDDHGRAWSAGADPPPTVELANFRYAAIAGLEACGAQDSDCVGDRLRWIGNQTESGRDHLFAAQPYRLFSQVLADAGYLDAVKRVALAGRIAERRALASPLQKAGSLFLEVTSGYGYSATRAAATLVVYYLIGWLGILFAARLGVFETSPFIDGSILSVVKETHPTSCPWLKPPLYALDLMVPLVTLGTENFCSVRAEEVMWSWVQMIYRLVGWVIVSIAILTFSGILKREA